MARGKAGQLLRLRVAPNLIPSLGTPEAQVLWMGCSDSGFAETQTLDLLPEEIIEHRNPANVFSNGDMGASSTLEYALRILQVKHIIVAGHYGCRLVNTAAKNSPTRNCDVSGFHEHHGEEPERNGGSKEHNRRLVELHVWSQAQALLRIDRVRGAQQARGLKVHAFVYDSDANECIELMTAE
ncbi:carbonic anhydrase [Clohesyomyces aquaticus]|uniref:Carbonic anhydrase n=1 Tax=Clohesyomyces aquaticus TaxID=1231657 RepID=A0A1Y2A0U5_9PLEO|nr:carbonic anhydrase [Clohesyomyces aquaticus]